MEFLPGAAAGLVWGILIALLNNAITKASLKTEKTAALMGANAARTLVDLAALGMVFLLRNQLPFRFESALVATAVGLSITTIVLAYQMGK